MEKRTIKNKKNKEKPPEFALKRVYLTKEEIIKETEKIEKNYLEAHLDMSKDTR